MTEPFGHRDRFVGAQHMYRKQEWESLSRVVPEVVPPEAPMLQDQGPNPRQEAVPLQPSVERHAPAKPNAAEIAPVGTKRRRYSLRRLAIGGALLLAVGAAGWFGYDWWTVGRFTVSTDDAYVGAYNTTLAAKVAGYIANVAVT